MSPGGGTNLKYPFNMPDILDSKHGPMGLQGPVIVPLTDTREVNAENIW